MGDNNMEKLMGRDQDRAIADQLLSRAKQTQLGPKLKVVYCQLEIE